MEKGSDIVSGDMRTIIFPTFIRSATFAFCVLLAACTSWGVTRFDPITYKSLTDLVPIAPRVYSNFAEPQVDSARVDTLELQLEQIEEYETWKGSENQDMVDQVKDLRRMFQKHVAERASDGPWTKVYAADKRELFLRALTEAIKTETAKNRSTQ
jgi:hypothetical protein